VSYHGIVPSKGLTDIPGLLVGHAADLDALTGCTVILAPSGAVCGVDIRGGASGTQEIDTLSPFHVTEGIHGLVFAGGSAFGLEAASGVRRFLEEKKIGFETRAARVPIVPSAILYDLAIGKADVRPTREMGYAAANKASDAPVAEGNVGAGAGCTVGKLFGMTRAMKAGIGSATVSLGGGLLVSALAAVNAFGDIRDAVSGKILAGARQPNSKRDFADTAESIRRGAAASFKGTNTTLVAVATNAKLSKITAAKVAQLGQVGLSRVISPAYTMIDGDMIFCLSPASATAGADIHALGLAAADAVAIAIQRGVTTAKSAGGVPGLSD
jgi:L-aminopeptidase/D-esterase-like protein